MLRYHFEFYQVQTVFNWPLKPDRPFAEALKRVLVGSFGIRVVNKNVLVWISVSYVEQAEI